MRALLVFAVALLLAGCGGGSGDEQEVTPDTNALAAAAERTTERGSVRMTLTGTTEVAGQRATQEGEGIADLRGGRGHLTTTVEVAGQSLESEVIMDGGTMYMKLPLGNLPEGKEWASVNLDEVLGTQAFSSGSATDPSQYLQTLAGAADVQKVGDAEVDGEPTTHYRAVIDYERLAEDGPEELRDLAEQSLDFGATKAPTEVWISRNGLIKQQRVQVETKAVGEIPAQKQDITTTYEEFGVDTSSIEPPPADLVLDVTEQTKDALP